MMLMKEKISTFVHKYTSVIDHEIISFLLRTEIISLDCCTIIKAGIELTIPTTY